MYSTRNEVKLAIIHAIELGQNADAEYFDIDSIIENTYDWDHCRQRFHCIVTPEEFWQIVERNAKDEN